MNDVLQQGPRVEADGTLTGMWAVAEAHRQGWLEMASKALSLLREMAKPAGDSVAAKCLWDAIDRLYLHLDFNLETWTHLDGYLEHRGQAEQWREMFLTLVGMCAVEYNTQNSAICGAARHLAIALIDIKSRWETAHRDATF